MSSELCSRVPSAESLPSQSSSPLVPNNNRRRELRRTTNRNHFIHLVFFIYIAFRLNVYCGRVLVSSLVHPSDHSRPVLHGSDMMGMFPAVQQNVNTGIRLCLLLHCILPQSFTQRLVGVLNLSLVGSSFNDADL
jgi:hypothetical protein